MAKEKSSSSESTPTKVITKSKKPASQSRLKVVAAAASAGSGRNGRSTDPSPEVLDQEIRLRAYEFYCERGGQHGGHEDDWLRAEQEVRERYRERYQYGT